MCANLEVDPDGVVHEPLSQRLHRGVVEGCRGNDHLRFSASSSRLHHNSKGRGTGNREVERERSRERGREREVERERERGREREKCSKEGEA